MKYLDDIPLTEALARWSSALDAAGVGPIRRTEVLGLDQASGRVLADAAWARLSSPHYHASAMDGVAVVAEKTRGASETNPIHLTIGEDATWVDTGEPLPSDRDAVIMIEDVRKIDERTIEIIAPVAPWQHVRSLGEDIVATEMVVRPGQTLTPFDLGALAAAGIAAVTVRAKPLIAIIPTGSELVARDAEPKEGDIIEFNSIVLSSQLREWGAQPEVFPVIHDDFDAITNSVEKAAAAFDAVLIGAGSSAGSEDYTARVVSRLGELVVHGVAIRPGHPQILGIIDGTPILGMPGYPVSTALNSEIFVRPLIERLAGAILPERSRAKAVLSRKIVSPMGEDEYLRVSLGRVGERLIATPLGRGAGKITTLSRADGLVVIPARSEGWHAGTDIEVELLRPAAEIERTIVAIGSHDLTLDILAAHLATAHPGMRLVSSNVGSLGGLVALQRGEAHFAGCHLLDEETGEYNVPFVRRNLPGKDAVVVTLVHRHQGLMVRKENPKAITTLEDLARRDVRFVNRQRGSGTRVLLDFELGRRGIDPGAVTGYEREEVTHLAVAAMVASGAADCGLGIRAAAAALGLHFIPVTTERYDLVALRETWEGELLRPLRELVLGTSGPRGLGASGLRREEGRSPERQASAASLVGQGSEPSLRDEIEALGGYDTKETGVIRLL